MIFKRTALLIASLLLFPCAAQADTKSQDRSFSINRRADAFRTGEITGKIETFCLMAKLGIISSADTHDYIDAYIDGFKESDKYRHESSKTAHETVQFAIKYIKKVNPDCFKIIPAKLQ